MIFTARTAVAALIVAAGLAAPSVNAETLADALVFGYENSGLLDQNRALLRAADEDVAQAVSALLPVVNWAASTSLDYDTRNTNRGFVYPVGDYSAITANIGISASLTLYDGGGNRLAIDAQKETVLATRQALLGVEQRVLLRIINAYVDVLRAGEFVTLAENNARVIGEELKAAQDRFEVGEVTRTDVSTAEARLAASQSQLASEQGAFIRAVEEYRAAVGRSPGDLAPVSVVEPSQSVAEAKSIAQRNHPFVLEAQHTVTVSELNILRAEAAMRPTLNATAQAGYVAGFDEDFDQSASVGLELSGPIYQGGRLSSQVRQFVARRDASRSNLLVVAQNVDQNVGNAYSFLDASRASLAATNEGVRAALEAFEGIREEATLGARTTLDVLDSEQELLRARSDQIAAQYDEVVASYGVLASMGLLTAQNLNLSVQIYDPTAYYNLVDDAPTAMSAQGRALDRVLQSIGGN